MPPRFPDESVTYLKRTMLARQPHFMFTASDVQNVMKETGLDKDQIQVWADHLRHRFKIKKLDDTLDFLRSKKEKPTRATRFFVSCFDVTPDFVSKFRYQKKDDEGEFLVKYMEAAFAKDAMSGEFFVEFEKPVNDTNVVECFQEQDAKGINIFTFPNDKSESASDALLRIMTLQDKTGLKISRGTCSETLTNQVKDKQAKAAEQEEMGSKEFDEKTAAALNMKLEDVNGNVKGVMDSMQSHGVELVSHGAKLDSQGVIMEDIKHGVCDIIPELQAKNANLVKEVTHHILQRDIQEAKTATQTRKVNEKDAEISALHKREEAHLKKIEQLEKDSDVSKAVENLKEMLQLVREEQAFARAERADNARCAADNARSAEYLASMIDQAEERAAKRPRV